MTISPTASAPRTLGSAGNDPGTQAQTWQATRAQTQLARDEQAYLGAEQRDIGTPVGEHLCELFVSCDAGPALQQQFEHLRPEFIAIHDMATHSSRKLLSGIATASQQAVHRLVIRRQGYGNTLATLEFVELPTAEGKTLRIYSTEADADTASRHALARMLLAFSTLGVILVGEVPGHSIAGMFQPLHEHMITGPWPNRNLLLLPLSAANALVTQGIEMARGTGVDVRTTPHVARPADAWNFISSTWTRMRDKLGPQRGAEGDHSRPTVDSDSTQASTAPLPLRPMPAVSSAAAQDPASQDLLTRYVNQLSQLTGMISCCVFEVSTGKDVAHAGASPGATELAEHGSDLMAAMLTASRTLGLGHALPDAALTLGSHHLVLRPVPKRPGLALHAVLDKTQANLTLARLQIARMDTLFD